VGGELDGARGGGGGVGADAAELRGDVVDDGLAARVEGGWGERPGLGGEDHGVELVDGGDQGVLRVFEDFCVAGWC
jgi:hypothetical protein